ncbi:MAG: YdjY domain-containing protein [Pirellulaceae bacterium]
MSPRIRLLFLSLPLFFLAGCERPPTAQEEKPSKLVQLPQAVEKTKPEQIAPSSSTAPQVPEKLDKEKPSDVPQVADSADAQTKEDAGVQPPKDPPQDQPNPEIVMESKLPEPDPNWTRMDPQRPIWIDADKKQVIVAGQICLRMGQLEMFACPKHSKEHESVVVIGLRPELIHAGLLSLDINPGKPVQYDPEFKPASGPEIEIRVRWLGEKGVKEVRSQEMVRSFRDKKEMTSPWVFGGSIFYEDPDGGQTYAANHGSFICLSNFPDAMIDVPVQSSDSADSLLFEANTEKIPPLGTQVYLIFEAAKKPEADKK